MSYNSRLKPTQLALAATATGAVAAGTTVGTASTNKLLLGLVADGTHIACSVSMVVNTSSLTLTPKWQGSHNGTTWFDMFALNSAANVATAAGTGSDVTTARTLLIPKPPFKYARVVFVTAGAAAHASNDTYEIVGYHYVSQGF